MIQKNPFLKYLIKDDKKDVFHSSGYAKAQSGETIGAASTESFRVRVNVNQNRQIVRGYRDSKIMMDANKNAPKPKAYVPEQEKMRLSDRTDARMDGVRNDAVISDRTSVAGRAPQVPIRRMGISIKK